MTTTAEPVTLADSLPGRHRKLITDALVSYYEQLQRLAKKEDTLGLSAVATGPAMKDTLKLLRQLGWQPPAKKTPADDSGDHFEEEPE